MILVPKDFVTKISTSIVIVTYSLNIIYLLLNHIRNLSSQYNHPYNLLVTRIINTLKTSHHNIIIHKVRAHTNIVANDKVDKLAKQGLEQKNPALQILLSTSLTIRHCIGHLSPIHPHTHEGSICNLKNYIEKEYASTFISYAKNMIPYIDKWLTNTNIHIKWSNLLWGAPWITDTQITQTLKFRYERYLRYYWVYYVLKQNISPTCNLCTSHQNAHAFTYYHVAQINT